MKSTQKVKIQYGKKRALKTSAAGAGTRMSAFDALLAQGQGDKENARVGGNTAKSTASSNTPLAAPTTAWNRSAGYTARWLISISSFAGSKMSHAQRQKLVSAVRNVQALYRANKAAKRDRSYFICLGRAVLLAQRLWRARRTRARFVRLRGAAVLLQRHWRRHRHYRRIWAAVCIQCAWRGHRVRTVLAENSIDPMDFDGPSNILNTAAPPPDMLSFEKFSLDFSLDTNHEGLSFGISRFDQSNNSHFIVARDDNVDIDLLDDQGKIICQNVTTGELESPETLNAFVKEPASEKCESVHREPDDSESGIDLSREQASTPEKDSGKVEMQDDIPATKEGVLSFNDNDDVQISKLLDQQLKLDPSLPKGAERSSNLVIPDSSDALQSLLSLSSLSKAQSFESLEEILKGDSRSLQVSKLGEATFAEVFRVVSRRGELAMKLVPFDGPQLVSHHIIQTYRFICPGKRGSATMCERPAS